MAFNKFQFLYLCFIVLTDGDDANGHPLQFDLALPENLFYGDKDLTTHRPETKSPPTSQWTPVNAEKGWDQYDLYTHKSDNWSDWKIALLIFFVGLAVITGIRWLLRTLTELCVIHQQRRARSRQRRQPRLAPVVTHLITETSTSHVYTFNLNHPQPPRQNLVPVHVSSSNTDVVVETRQKSPRPGADLNGEENEVFYCNLQASCESGTVDVDRNCETPPPPYSPSMTQ